MPLSHVVAACGLIAGPDGKIIMILSPRRGWEIPGGQVEEDESIIHALRREVREETGVEIDIGPLVGIYSNLKPPPLVVFSFLCQYRTGIFIPSEESLEVEWVPPSEALARVTHPAVRARIQDLLEFTGRVKYLVYRTDPFTVIEENWLSQ